MRILIISSLFPPDVIGGAEISAHNCGLYLKSQGHEVAVLATAADEHDILDDVTVEGLRIWRFYMPRLYPPLHYANHPLWKKALFHLQDHFDPRNKLFARHVLKTFKPDHIYIHVIQGLGWNILSEVAKTEVPTTYFLHDLSLACYRTSMYRGNKECARQCALCKLSCTYKTRQLRKIKDLKFISPSKANLERVSRYVPIKDYPNTHILNPNKYPPATTPRTESDLFRFLYVGRLDSLKGVDLLLSVADELSKTRRFKLTLIGTGRDEDKFRRQYQGKDWCHFAGFVSQEEVSNHMINTDILCVPSVWFENSPGVVIHALGLGLPVIGSNYGGIGELIDNDQNGMLVKAGDPIAWKEALESVIDDPSRRERWREQAKKCSDKFNAEINGKKIFEFSRQQKITT